MKHSTSTWAISTLLVLSTQTMAADFRTPDGSELALAIERQFVRPMLSSISPDDQVVFEWMGLDVTGDDYDELFIKLGSLCASKDCPIVGFMRRDDGSWFPILTAVGQAIVPTEDGITVRTENGNVGYAFDAENVSLLPIK